MLIIGNSVFTISHWRQGSGKVKGENIVHGLARKYVSTKLPLRVHTALQRQFVEMRPT